MILMIGKVATATFEHAALLRVAGFEFVEPEFRGRRVILWFKDSDGKAEELLRRHEAEGVPVNSRSYADGLAWAKNIIFAARDQVVA